MRAFRRRSSFRQLMPLVGAAILAVGVRGGAVQAANPPSAPSKPVSSCVACHTDLTKLQEEAKGILIPTGSALQAGKG